ncbi:MAG: hypothetical protein ACD_3C00037G0014 [uncultured bacterium (gcode 4)]|uniref:Nucleoside diphosphate kinase-like domain-containing protein n=1 Tax=uncultured bacterium (gcode 4) TaxID=1234023 RepID=K2G0A4_9BACT|nr:MAG: hypothetical protein ACD_3C00037G0014 [uncultured bacterium (gcode 4)]
MNSNLVTWVLNALSAGENETIISPFEFNGNKENEFLIFFKPEVFFSADEAKIRECVNMTLSKLEENEIDVNWAILFTWSRLAELEIMDRHYGFINRVSKNISKIATPEEKQKIYEVLEISAPEEYEIFGGHEFLAANPDFNEESLDELWLSKKSAKVRSGFYAQKYEVNGKKVVLVNAFHPVQLKHYTDPTHKTVVLLCNSDKAWNVLKDNVAWDTFPEKSVPESVRWEFFANKEKYGLADVSISFNCIHMSAGPFEAAFEIDNFLKNVEASDYSPSKTNLFSKVSSKWFSENEILKFLTNPKNSEGKALFDVTENVNTSETLELLVDFN